MDTNAGIDLLDGRLPIKAAIWLDNHVLSENIAISVINKIELMGFNMSTQSYTKVQALVNTVDILNLTDTIVNETIALRKINKIKLPDAIIAATALVHNLTLISRNKKDFKAIAGLTCIDLYTDI
jgi:toxin FitB